ncbi:GNAT family N-acetyltransferase [Denitrobaculum tricleocarpae]|uniref:GNAT family N-acetyltransferase n=1 Tax=Denitrobaculum tricleocarpae TaxID=2591009 RepID=A0A545U2A2_9PROT|nr:GNAT family N-acetyltransferase [Denitrobaculum tricleocarpae]TQV83610.1 GNAT family N-acetyltransferase [Denitrobaculum tricleocarpae]
MRSNEIVVRPADQSEFSLAGDVAVAAFSRLRPLLPEGNWPVMAKGIRFTTAEDSVGCLFVAVLSGEILGSVRYTGPGHGGHIIYPDSFAYIRAVAVSQAYARCGVGRKLTQACIDAALEDRAEAVGLHVAVANEAARNLYGKMGFEPYRDAPDYFGIPYTAYAIRFRESE